MIRLIAGLALLLPTLAAAQGSLVLYCAPQEEWCRAMVTAFERKTGVKVAMTRKSSGAGWFSASASASVSASPYCATNLSNSHFGKFERICAGISERSISLMRCRNAVSSSVRRLSFRSNGANSSWIFPTSWSSAAVPTSSTSFADSPSSIAIVRANSLTRNE